MKRAFFIIGLSVVFLFGATACTSSALMPGATTQGKVVTIVLEENPTTGYTWSVAIDRQDVLTLTSDKYTASQTNQKLVGSGGVHAYDFKATSPGTATIKFDLGQQWTGGQRGAQTKTYQVTVGQDGSISSVKEIQ